MKTRISNSQIEIPESKKEFNDQISYYVNKNRLLEARPELENHKTDPNAKRLLYFLFTGTRGGHNRLRIMLLLAENPLNTHQIAKELGLDYKAIQFHLGVLEKNNMVSRAGERYGTIFMLSTFLEYNIDAFNEIISKVYKNFNSR